MAKLSLEQLRSRSWDSEDKALRALKASGVPSSGADYALGEHKPGDWQLLPRDQLDESPDVGREQRVIDLLRKKPGAKPRGEPEVLLHARAPGKKNARAPKSVDGTQQPEPAPPPAEEPAPEPTEPIEVSPLPREAGPYDFIVAGSYRGGDAASTHIEALVLSKRLKAPVDVRNAAGDVVRRVDSAAYEAARRRRPGAPRAPSPRAPRADGKNARVVALLRRPEGASKAEIIAITEWSFGERYIHRLAHTSRTSAETIGKDHWRLIKT